MSKTLASTLARVFVVLVLGLVAVAAAGCSETSDQPSAPLPTAVGESDSGLTGEAMAEAVREQANRARQVEGLDALARSGCLATAARERAAALVGEPLEHRPLAAVAARCVPGGRVAENLVRSSATAEAVVEAWLGSPGHRNNLLDPALRMTGIGCVPDGGELLCAQLFADTVH